MRWREVKRRDKRVIKKEVEVMKDFVYGKFIARLFALVMDMFMIIIPINLLIGAVFGMEALKNPETSPMAGLVQLGLLALTTIIFWAIAGQTPGKRAFNLQVVDSKTLNIAPLWKLVIRYIAYFVSLISLIGFFIPLFRKDNKTLHDIISGTIVIEKKDS